MLLRRFGLLKSRRRWVPFIFWGYIHCLQNNLFLGCVLLMYFTSLAICLVESYTYYINLQIKISQTKTVGIITEIYSKSDISLNCGFSQKLIGVHLIFEATYMQICICYLARSDNQWTKLTSILNSKNMSLSIEQLVSRTTFVLVYYIVTTASYCFFKHYKLHFIVLTHPPVWWSYFLIVQTEHLKCYSLPCIHLAN